MEYDPQKPINFSGKISRKTEKSRLKMLDIYLAVFFAVIPHTLLIGAYIKHLDAKNKVELEEKFNQQYQQIKRTIEDEFEFTGMYYIDPKSRPQTPATKRTLGVNERCINGIIFRKQGNTWEQVGRC